MDRLALSLRSVTSGSDSVFGLFLQISWSKVQIMVHMRKKTCYFGHIDIKNMENTQGFAISWTFWRDLNKNHPNAYVPNILK